MTSRRTSLWHRAAAATVASILVSGTVVMTTTAALAQSINAGDRQPVSELPFTVTEVGEFDTPWSIAFLPDGRMLVTEKPGAMYLVTQDGGKIEVEGMPQVSYSGQIGMLDVAPAPSFADDNKIYISYVGPGEGGSILELATATLSESDGKASLVDLNVIFRQTPPGGRGQPGGIIAFSPDNQHLFLSTGDRMVPDRAQDPDDTAGKILRLNLDGSIPDDNPNADKGGVQAMTWSMGHRNPYGLAFAPDGRLWEHEMGPKGGDEFNLIEAGKNYGWPEVSNGSQYSGTPIPDHSTRPEFAAPPLYWTPVIAPAGLTFYEGDMFPEWKGSALIGGLAATTLVRVAFDGSGNPDEAERYDMEARIRDVAVGPDGAVWLAVDDSPAPLLKLTPKAE